MKYEAIITAIDAGLTMDIKPETPQYIYFRQALNEYDAVGSENFNVLVQDAAKKLKAKLSILSLKG